MALHPQKVGYGISVGGHLMLVAMALFGFLTSTTKPEEGESVPVEIVSDEPAQSTRGERRGERTPTPQRVVDRQTPDERPTPDDPNTPVARERVQTVQLPPPPTPRPQVQQPQPEAAEPPPPAPRPAQVAAVQPPTPTPPQPQPRPTPSAQEVREDLAAREAEIQAQKKREEEQQRQEQQRVAEQRRRQEQQRQEQQRVAEQREREQREAREKQEREQRERVAREARERQQREQREAAERAERQRQERANARAFDPSSIAARLNTSQANDRRQASRTEATGASAPMRTASLGTATGAASRISGRESDAIRAWVERCWEIPIAAREGDSPAVRLRIAFNPDGTVSARPEVQNPRGDSNFQVLANSAVRAVMRCSAEGGVRLPRERYDTWREVVLNFDPKEMR